LRTTGLDRPTEKRIAPDRGLRHVTWGSCVVQATSKRRLRG